MVVPILLYDFFKNPYLWVFPDFKTNMFIVQAGSSEQSPVDIFNTLSLLTKEPIAIRARN